MNRKLVLTLGAAMLSVAASSGASAQSATKPGMQAPSVPAAVTATTSRPGTAAADSSQVRTPGMSFLTEQECRNLGGAVHTAPQCKKTQQRCVIRLAGGQINAPCIDEVAEKK